MMLSHLVAFRPGLWWQTTGDGENAALQFSKVPTQEPPQAEKSCVCVCVFVFSVSWWGALFMFF